MNTFLLGSHDWSGLSVQVLLLQLLMLLIVTVMEIGAQGHTEHTSPMT